MFKDIKRGASRAKEKMRRAVGSHKRDGTPATQPVVGDPDTHGAPSGPESSHVDTSAAHIPSVAVSQPEPHNITLHSDPASTVPALMSVETPALPPNPEPSHADVSLPRLLTAAVSPVPASGNARPPNLAPTGSTPPAKQGGKDTAWAGLKTLLGVLNESNALAPLKSAVDGLMKCTEIYKNQASAGKGYDKLRTELDDLCQHISGYIRGAATPSMTPYIANLARGIEVETELVLQKGQRNAVGRYAGAMEDADEILECYRRIQMHLAQLTLNANLNVWKIVEEQAMQNRLDRLPYSPAAEYRSTESSNLGRNGCTPNTRMDVLEQLRVWSEDSKSQKIYWLNGMAGTGKTTIAYSLCKRIESAGNLAASFFCSRQSPECRDVGRILPSIAYQLSMFSRAFRYAISNVLEKDPGAYNRPPDEQFENLIAAPLREIGHTLPSDLVIVIDALDECDSANGMSQMLSALLAHAPNLALKVFVTSRPDPNILDEMRSEQAKRVRSELRLHGLERSTVQSDIRTYLMAEFGKLELEPTDMDKLVEKSGVLFVYAATVVRYVKHNNFARAPQRLKLILSTTATDTGHHRELNALYATILQAALDDNTLDDSEREEMIRVLRTVICAQEPLSVSDIAGLLGLDGAESVHADLQPLLSVLHISDSSGLITTLHESFPDYLFDEKRSKQFYCDAKRHHAWFTHACFNLFKSPNPPFNICNLESSYLLDNEVPDLEARVRNNIPQHLFYACRCWEAHVEAAEVSEELVNGLFEFLSTRLLLWMEIMHLKKDIQGAVPILSKLTFLQRVQCSSEIRELTRDALHFVAEFASREEKQPTPHIYMSALAMWPEHRPVSQCYRKIRSNLIKTSGAALGRHESALLATLRTSEMVLCVAYSPDGARIVSGSKDKTIRIRDAHTGQVLGQPLQGHTGSVNSVAYSHDGARIVSGSDDHTIRIWDAHTGEMVGQPLQGHTRSVSSAAYSHNGARVASGSDDYTIRIWDTRTGRTVGKPLQGHTGWVNSVAYSHDGARIVSGSDDYTIRIWDTRTGRMVRRPLQGHTGSVESVAYSRDGARVVSGSRDNTVRIWDARTGQMIGQPLRGHTHFVWSVAYSHGGARIVSGSSDNTIRIWDAHTGQMVGQPLKGHALSVWSVAFSHDGTRIVSGSGDKTIRIWDARTGRVVSQPPQGHARSVFSVAYSRDGARIVSGSDDYTIRIWDARTGLMVGQPLQGHTGSVKSVAYSRDGARIVSGSSDNTIRIWDAQSGQRVGQPLLGHTGIVWSVAYSRDGARIVSGSLDNTIRIWDARTGQMIGQPLQGHTGSINSVADSYDGEHVVSGSEDNTIRIWDAYTSQMVGQPLRGHTGSVNSVAYSGDGALIVSGSEDKTIRIWDATTGQMVGQPLRGHTSSVFSVAYSPDRARVVSGSYDNTIRIWDAYTGEMIGQPLQGHTRSVRSVAYSPDGERIVSGSDDSAIRTWDAQAGQTQEQPLEGGGHSIDSGTSWTLSRAGWVVTPQLQRLIWIPSHLRIALLRPLNTLIISAHGSVRLDFSNAKFGDEWQQCYRL